MAHGYGLGLAIIEGVLTLRSDARSLYVSRNFAIVVIAAGLGSPVLESRALAQTASQIAPPVNPPTEVRPPSVKAPSVQLDDRAQDVPAEAQSVSVSLGDIAIVGTGADIQIPNAVWDNFRAALVGKKVSVATIFAEVRDLEGAFGAAGHVLVRVVVPEQRLTDGGTLTLAIIDGFIADLDLSAVPSRLVGRVRSLLTPLVGQRGITLGDIERKLLIAADVPGLQLQSTLREGKVEEATTLIITATSRPVSGSLSVDNTLSDPLGRYTVSLGLNLNGWLGLGEQVYLRVNGLPNLDKGSSFLDPTPRNRALAAGIVVPIGDDGLTANFEATDARAAPRPSTLNIGFASKFERLAWRLRYPVVRRRSLTLATQIGFDVQEERIRLRPPIDQPVSRDSMRIVRLTGDVDAALPGDGRAYSSLSASFGINGLGARSARDAAANGVPLSRQGADSSFQLVSIAAAVQQPLASYLALNVRAEAQLGFGQALVNAEQIGIAGPNTLSAFPNGALQGDDGYVVRSEAQFPLARGGNTLLGVVVPYVFGAQGAVRLQQPTAVERRVTSADSFGAGARFIIAQRRSLANLAMNFEYATGHREGESGLSDRFTFAVQAQF